MESFTNNELNISELPRLEEQSYQSLHKSYLTIILLFRIVMALIMLGGIGISWFKNPEAAIWLTPIAVVIGSLFVLFGYLGFFKKGFAMREKDVSYKRGLIFHSVTVVPLNRIQHSELVRGPFDRMFGLASVKIYTAGGSTSDITIPGLEVSEAENVREYITSKIKAEANAHE